MKPPLPFDRSPRRPGELGHDTVRVHAAGQHVAVVAIACDHLVASFVVICMPTTTASWPM